MISFFPIAGVLTFLLPGDQTVKAWEQEAEL